MTTPAEGFLGKLGGIGEQLVLWGILQQALGAVGGPALEELTALVNTDFPLTRLSPADAATAANRSFLTETDAASEAAAAGIDPGRFNTMRSLAGTAPGPQELVTALMRGIIPRTGSGAGTVSYEQGIREGNLLDKWAAMLEKLGQQPLSPADAASAAVRNFLPSDQAQAEAGKSGVDPAVFQTLVHLSGDAPGPQQLAEALRRGDIPATGTGPDSTSFQQGIAEGRLADKWTSTIKALAKIWPTPPLALDALLKGQLTETDAQALYEKLGGDPQFFQTLYDTRGNAPSPVEALQLANRGIIPWTGTGADVVSYEQAFKEGPWRNKWEPAFKALADYIPPPETVRTLLEQGAITHDQASKWWNAYGLPADTVQAYLNAANFNNTAATRGLTESSVLDMYYAQLTTRDDAAKLLSLFGVPAQNQDLMLAYVDMRRAIAAVNSAVSRIQALFVGRKISVSTASDALNRLKIPAATVDSIIQTWQLEASVNVKTLTESHIVDAWDYGIMNQATAQAELVAIGYTPYDAWVQLSIKNKAPLPNPPAREVATPLGAVVPGVT